ncbi:MAG TPA: RNA polymerase sigma factor [Gemmatimonadaceae bacterium]|nr:RNA polymerase sigma factor [Gemmatimonadaceae bacterium]
MADHALMPVGSLAPPRAVSAPHAVPSDEAQLVARIRCGDEAAFTTLVRRYVRRAYAVAYRIVRDREDAEDVVQETFMAVLDHINEFDDARPFAPWFFRILRNRSLNAQKSRRVRRAEPVPDGLPDRHPSPAVEMERSEVHGRFQAAVQRLPERQRMVVQLVDVDGVASVDVAARLGVSAGTVRWYLHEARAALRAALAPFKGENT